VLTLTPTMACAQCGREAPEDAVELARWRHGDLALDGVTGEGLLVCPDCDADHRERTFEEGGSD
jgi:hypothetical protein